MGRIITRSTRIIQPHSGRRIDWSHPIAGKFNAFVVPSGGSLINYSRLKCDPYAERTGPGIDVAPGLLGFGAGAATPHTHTYRLNALPNRTDTVWESIVTQGTWFALVVQTTGTSSGHSPIFHNASPFVHPYTAWGFSSISGTSDLSCAVATSGTYHNVIVLGGLVINTPLMLVGRYTGAALDCFINGRHRGTRTCSGDVIYPNDPTARGPSIGNFYNYTTQNRGFTGRVFLAGIAPVALSDSEIAHLSADPYQIFAARQHRLYFDVGAGAPAGAALESAATATAASSGTLTAQITLSGDALAQAVSTALLSSGITMTAAAVAQAAADGTLTTAIQLLGSAQAQSDAAGNLTTSTGGLEGNAQAQSDATAILTTQIRLSGDAVAQAEAAGSLGGIVDLAGAAVSGATASGELTVNIALTAQALATAIAQGSLTTQIMLAADATAQAGAGAELSGGCALVVEGGDILIARPRHSVLAARLRQCVLTARNSP